MSKLDLEKLKVQSFVTSLEKRANKTIKGGNQPRSINYSGCNLCLQAPTAKENCTINETDEFATCPPVGA